MAQTNQPEIDKIIYIPRNSQIGRPEGWYWRGPLFLYGPFRSEGDAEYALDLAHEANCNADNCKSEAED